MANKDSEQLRDFVNKIDVNGTLATMEVREGETENKVPYISVKGSIQFGETGVETLNFRSFALAQKSDGTDSKAYANLVKWVENAVPMTEDKAKATKGLFRGSFASNDFYTDKDGGAVVESNIFNVSGFFDYDANFNEQNSTNAIVDFEGYVKAIADETKGEEKTPTGRKRITLVGLDYRKEAIVLKNVILTEDIAEDFMDLLPVGSTAKFTLGYYVHKGQTKRPTGGLGKQRVTEGRDYLELVLEGCSDPYEDDKEVITTKIMKELMNVREAKLARIKEEGENGTTTSSASTKKAKVEHPAVTEEDIPF